MRQSQHGKKPRGRGRKPHNPLVRVYDSSGPDVKIRGTASHIAEKYMNLARDAHSSGDRIAAENYLQHAEHYHRIIAAAQAQMGPINVQPAEQQPQPGDGEADDNGFGQAADHAPDGSQQNESRSRRGRRRNGHGDQPNGEGRVGQGAGATQYAPTAPRGGERHDHDGQPEMNGAAHEATAAEAPAREAPESSSVEAAEQNEGDADTGTTSPTV